MSDLHELLQRAVSGDEPSQPGPERVHRSLRRKRVRQRVSAGVLAAVVAVGGVLLLANTFSPAPVGDHPQPQSPRPGPPVAGSSISSSGVVLDGSLNCTATLPLTPLQAGRETGLTFTLHNISNHAVSTSLGYGQLGFVLKAADGTKFDTRLASGVITGPYITPILIPVGKSRANLGEDVRIRWAGPLSVTPMCLGTPLPALRTDVGAPEPAPTDAAALTSVIGATGGFLDHCQPKQAGVPVQGLIFPPSGSTPPMQAQCSIKLEDQGAFLVAQLRVITPTELQGLRISEPYERITMPNQGGNSEVVVWGFVVTERGATPVYATTESQTKRANGVVTSWQWDGSSWVTGGSSRCGGSELSGGGWQGYVSFVSACAP